MTHAKCQPVIVSFRCPLTRSRPIANRVLIFVFFCFSIWQHFWAGVHGANGLNATKMANESDIARAWPPTPIRRNAKATNVTSASVNPKWQMVNRCRNHLSSHPINHRTSNSQKLSPPPAWAMYPPIVSWYSSFYWHVRIASFTFTWNGACPFRETSKTSVRRVSIRIRINIPVCPPKRSGQKWSGIHRLVRQRRTEVPVQRPNCWQTVMER